ncbi:uncharacterized beta-barrel protein YwiB (DUF1934 family) [Lachnospiraceae bacterium PF1-21]|uniref:DUF1934 domain-containing protein n=1 Tax=Ohessyouella blattaphilus TaxID=2949333 RepID=A0ABT1EHW7_9FIRM|nr:DUF1934 domain-containing protein [Ohessyouella blattaphilus]MCP1110302.1 DUF1934 domain-containing protein [Ohessyouella blattaphilus]MCR8563696.1 DUF1934 domain-containing protein [Ohessyouella blattaphilus]MDL2249229.1 DUF1934 domain-containing protein [Lachnospiraceae bacterium OttesenSCG-928-J05]
MKKQVILSISGLHFGELAGDGEAIEVITPAEYYFRRDKHYILFEEFAPGTKEAIHSKLKLSPDKIEIIKGGHYNTRIVFERERMNMSHYNTPYGDLMIGTMTKQLSLQVEEEEIEAKVLYSLEINDEWAADCNVNIHVKNA